MSTLANNFRFRPKKKKNSDVFVYLSNQWPVLRLLYYFPGGGYGQIDGFKSCSVHMPLSSLCKGIKQHNLQKYQEYVK